LAERYINPNPDLFRPQTERQRARSAFLTHSRSDYLGILKAMDDRGMLSFCRTPKVVNGLFATPKKGDAQRLVVDARPSNAVWVPSPKVHLPTPDLISQLQAKDGQSYYAAKADLDNYYHRLRLPSWMHPYFALPPVKAGELGKGEVFGPDTLIYPCCATLPMGWSHAAFLAQAAHEHVVDTRTSLRRGDRITASSDLRLDRPRHLIYIDDFNLFDEDSARAARLHREYNEAMEAVGLPPKLAKDQPPSAEGVECIGVVFHGRRHTVGVHPTKLARLVTNTTRLLERAECTGREMAALVGHWSWAFMPRRGAFSVFNAVYRFIETAGRRVFDVWPTAARELRTAIALAPLLFSSLRSEWFPEAVASDASESGMGVVAAARGAGHCALLARREPLPGPDTPRTLHPALRGTRWKEIISSRWRFKEHINVLEMRAADAAVRWAASRPSAFRARLVLLCDSAVVVGAIRKGRSSSYPLLRRLRVVAATTLALGIRLYVNWIATEVNPADRPSRRFEFDATLGFPGEGPAGREDFLGMAAFAPSTMSKYRRALGIFFGWLDQEGWTPDTVRDLDSALTAFLNDLYLARAGRHRSYGEAAVAGIQMMLPELKRRLPVASRALRGWRRLSPPVAHPPLTRDLAVLIGVTMALRGKWSQGVAVVLAFDCYLRIGELLGLRSEDVADVGDARVGVAHLPILRLAKTKRGSAQSVCLRDAGTVLLLRRLREGLAGGQRLFPFSASAFRRLFKSCCGALGLSSKYVPHSLRHGGATHDFLNGMALEEILHRGRWSSTTSARHYIQGGRAALLAVRVPADVALLASTLARDVALSFSLTQRH
jgi:integrase